MIDINALACSRAENVPQGAIAWIDSLPTPVFVLAGTPSEDGDEPEAFLMDLGGDQPFDIWKAGEVTGRPAFYVRGVRLEVDIASSQAMVSTTDRRGQAFVAHDSRGLIGMRNAGRPGARHGAAVTMAGDPYHVAHSGQAFSFTRWRIIHGEGDSAITIFEHDGEAPL